VAAILGFVERAVTGAVEGAMEGVVMGAVTGAMEGAVTEVVEEGIEAKTPAVLASKDIVDTVDIEVVAVVGRYQALMHLVYQLVVDSFVTPVPFPASQISYLISPLLQLPLPHA
jgi:hypothetical protein